MKPQNKQNYSKFCQCIKVESWLLKILGTFWANNTDCPFPVLGLIDYIEISKRKVLVTEKYLLMTPVQCVILFNSMNC